MATRTLHVPPAVHEALRRGDAIEAIRLLRDSTGIDLRTARQAIEALQRHGGSASTEPGSDASGAGAAGDRDARHPRLPPEVVTALSQGHLIEAVKRLRELQPMPLRDARDLVERHRQAATSRHPPTVAPGDSGGGMWGWLVLALVAIVGWIWWSGRG